MPSTEDVIEFLKRNPGFIEEHGDEIIQSANGNGETAFYQRQLEVLKERESRKKAKLDMIVDSARSNQRLDSDLIEMAVRLLSEDRHDADGVKTAAALVKRQFNVNDVSILINPMDGDQRHEKYDEVRQRVAHKNSICDDRVSSALLASLFDEDPNSIGSCAFVPLLYEEEIVGVMVLGSTDKQRFQPGAGVMYLNRLGLLVAGYIKGFPPN